MSATVDPDRRWADRCDSVGATLVALTLVFAPLAFDRTSTEVFVMAKLTLLRGLIAVAMSFWFLAFGLRRELAWRSTGFVAAVLLWLGWNAVTTLTSVSSGVSLVGDVESRRGLVTMIHLGLLALLALHHGRDPRRARRLLGAMLFGAVIAAAHATLQQFGVDPLVWADRNVDLGRATATLDDPSSLGAILASALPLAIAGMITTAASRKRRALFAAAALLLLAGLGFAAARAAILAAVIATGTLIFAHGRGKNWLRAGLAMVAVVAVMVATNDRVAVRFQELFAASWVDHDGLQAPTTAIAIVRARPWLGTGPDTFAIMFPRHASAIGDGAAIPRDALALPLQVAATTGIIGLALFALVLLQALRSGRRVAAVEGDLALVIACSLLAYLLQAMVTSTALAPSLWLWAGLGLLAARASGQRILPLHPLVTAVALAVAAAPIADVWLAARAYAADHSNRRASASSQGTTTSITSEEVSDLLARADAAVALDDDLLPRELEHWRRALADGDAKNAVAALEAIIGTAHAMTATQLAPRVPTYRATLAGRLQDVAATSVSPNRRAQFLARTEATFDGAIALSPADFSYHAARARLFASAGIRGDAESMAEAERGLDRAIERAPSILSLRGERFALLAGSGHPERILVLAGDTAGTARHRALVLRVAGRTLTDGAVSLREKDRAESAKRYLNLAVSAFGAARELAPKDPDAIHDHAAALLLDGNAEAARAANTRALELSPAHAAALALKSRQKW